MHITILIPTYNESENIKQLLSALHAVSSAHDDVILTAMVIDDSSPDGTAAVARQAGAQMASANFQVGLLIRPRKEGLGKAYIHGFKAVLAGGKPVDYVLTMDADLSHSPRYLASFITAARQGVDLVSASRYIPGGSMPDWVWYRKALSQAGNSYARTVLGRRITDYTGGFNMYALALLKSIDLDALNSVGYGFVIDLKYQALLKARRVAEIPIVFQDRQYGRSKMPTSTVLVNFFLVLKIKLQSRA